MSCAFCKVTTLRTFSLFKKYVESLSSFKRDACASSSGFRSCSLKWWTKRCDFYLHDIFEVELYNVPYQCILQFALLLHVFSLSFTQFRLDAFKSVVQKFIFRCQRVNFGLKVIQLVLR